MATNYFIDCGYYVGKAVEYYSPFLDSGWEIIAFEPNKDLDVVSSIERFNVPYTYSDKAVWVEDGELTFSITGRNDASYIDKLRDGDVDRTINVESIDFSKFVSELPKESKVVCSMDIEGAEYPVLRKMIRDGSITRISLLDIEFHYRILPDEDSDSTSVLIHQLQSCGVLVKLKIPIDI